MHQSIWVEYIEEDHVRDHKYYDFSAINRSKTIVFMYLIHVVYVYCIETWVIRFEPPALNFIVLMTFALIYCTWNRLPKEIVAGIYKTVITFTSIIQ